MITTGTALIRYVQDYNPLDTDFEVNTTQVNLPGRGRKYIKVAISDGTSTEFMIEYTYEALEKLRTAFNAMENVWTGPTVSVGWRTTCVERRYSNSKTLWRAIIAIRTRGHTTTTRNYDGV